MPKFSSVVELTILTKPVILEAKDEREYHDKVADLDEKDLLAMSDSVNIEVYDNDGEGTTVKKVGKSTKVTTFPLADKS